MKTLKNIAPELFSQLAAGLEGRGHSALAVELEHATTHRRTFGENDEIGDVYFADTKGARIASRPTPVKRAISSTPSVA